MEQCNKVKTFKCQAKKDKPKANTGTNPSNFKEDSLVAFMLKKLKIESEIQQMEYERQCKVEDREAKRRGTTGPELHQEAKLLRKDC